MVQLNVMSLNGDKNNFDDKDNLSLSRSGFTKVRYNCN